MRKEIEELVRESVSKANIADLSRATRQWIQNCIDSEMPIEPEFAMRMFDLIMEQSEQIRMLKQLVLDLEKSVF